MGYSRPDISAPRGRHVRPIKQSGIVLSETHDTGGDINGEFIGAGVKGARAGIVVYLRRASSQDRRDFRRALARKGFTEKVCQWLKNVDGERIPYALEITALTQSQIDGMLRECSDMIAGSHPIIDAPTFVHGAGCGNPESANAKRELKRRSLSKAESRARETRSSPEYRKLIREADKDSANRVNAYNEAVYGKIWDSQETTARKVKYKREQFHRTVEKLAKQIAPHFPRFEFAEMRMIVRAMLRRKRRA